MALDRWISNLESPESMADAVKRAASAVAIAQTPEEKRMAERLLATAKFKQADVAKTMKQIQMEHPRHSIGEPAATLWRTKEEIAADGIIGIYREGAGTGAV